MATKKQEREELVADDVFVESASPFLEWTEKNIKLILGVAGAVLVLAIAIVVVSQQKTRGASAATTKLTEAVNDYRDFTAPQAVMTSTVPEQARAKADALAARFSTLADEVPAGGLTGLYEADLLRRAGKFAEAQKVFSDYASSAAPGDPLLFLALEGAGYAAEEQGELDVAKGFFEKLTTKQGDFYKDHGFFHVGRVLEAKGDKDGALKAYEKIVQSFPDSKLRAKVDERLEALK